VRVLDRSRTHAHVEALSAHFEARLAPKKPWTTDKMEPHRLSAMLDAIVALEMTVEGLEASWKLGQNKAPADRAGAIAALRALHDQPRPHLLAALMEGKLAV
jgi:transcriptional regulator